MISELQTLNLPPDKFAITSSGPLGVRKMREINDFDLIVYPMLWDELAKKYPVDKDGDFESIYIGNIQILGGLSYFTDPQYGSVQTQIDSADIIDGIRYVQLPTILAIKKNKTRPKDIQDVKLIERYLATL